MRAHIKLAFRIVIDHNSSLAWDRYVFEDTYFEYKVQHQLFDDRENPVQNFWELLSKNLQAAKIPSLLSPAIAGYVAQLNGEIKSLPDVLGNTFFPVENFKPDLISSHTEDPSRHKIGITFYTPELLLIDIIEHAYLLSKNRMPVENGFDTFMFGFHPQVAIAYYKPL